LEAGAEGAHSPWLLPVGSIGHNHFYRPASIITLGSCFDGQYELDDLAHYDLATTSCGGSLAHSKRTSCRWVGWWVCLCVRARVCMFMHVCMFVCPCDACMRQL